jgi:phenylalanyl-tRNA synthetase alpha chain
VLVPPNHVSRKKSDTYYLNKKQVLRTHTTAHEMELLAGHDEFITFGDVYRRDEIDQYHYPVFHQMEAVRVFQPEHFAVPQHDVQMVQTANDLKLTLEGLVKHLFGAVEMRWIDAYFPFTFPSFELEILYEGKWLEMLGCGVLHPIILKNAGKKPDEIAWAAGLGLERFAMKLFDIPDVRLFWSEDPRFLDQFK